MGKYDNLNYAEAAHALQSATVIMMMQRTPCADPKHLRVGIDCRAADAKGLADLLIAKGVFTADEYREAVRKSMIEELERTAQAVCELYGFEPDKDITFG